MKGNELPWVGLVLRTEKSICGEFHQGENTTKNTTGCGDQAVVKFMSSCGGFYYKVVVSCGEGVVQMW